MSAGLRILASKPLKSLVSPVTVQCVQTRGLKRELVPNVTHHSYYKIYQHGRSPMTAKSLAQVLAEEKKYDPRIHYLVDIGLPPTKRSSQSREKTTLLLKNRMDPEMEKKSRMKTLEISLEEVAKEWQESLMPLAYCESAQHYGIFQDLYGDAFFHPRVPLNITFNEGTENAARVCRGNIIKPAVVSKPPSVKFSAEPDSLWTLILTNPDGHLTEENAEYVHWFIGNIPGNDVSKGQVIWDYLQPFPPHGTGYQRLVFVLYKQEERIDYSSFQKQSPCLDLTQRTFNTYDFYRPRQDVLTPAGLCFYQSVWDQSVQSFFHEVLEMEAPRFMYDFPADYQKKQQWFPHKEPFDLYLDRYRDPRDINKRYLIEKLTKIVDPFEKPPPPFKFPVAQYFGKAPSWLQMKIKRDRMGVGHIRRV